MHVTRNGVWLSFTPDLESPTDIEFLDSLGAIFVEKAKVYRVKYTEPIFKQVVNYVQENNGTMDSTCTALATFSETWLDKLYETTVPSKRPQMRHQKQGVTFLLQFKRAMLGFDMGTGKTKTAVDTITHMSLSHLVNTSCKNALIVTDASVVGVWVETMVNEDSDEKAIALIGTRTDRISRLRFGLANGYKYFVINYDGVPVIDDELTYLLSSNTVLVLDESQRVKNHTTKRFKTIWKIFEKLDFEYIFLLSGTPITQSPEDIFGQYAFVDCNIFGHPKNGWYGFRATYVQTAMYDQHVVIGYRNMRKFMEKFHSRCFRVKTSDVLDLPPKQYLPIKLDLPPQLAKCYKEYVASRGFVRVPGHPRQGDRDEVYISMHPFTMISKALQLANNFLYVPTTNDDGSEEVDIITLFEDCPNPKMDYILQLLEDTDQPIILTYHHKAMRQVLERALLSKRESFVSIDGSVPMKQRSDLFRRFTDGKVRTLVAQENVIRTGLNSLVVSRIIVAVERGYSVETRQQLEKRIHRLGMNMDIDSALYIDLMYAKTAEVTVYDQLRKGVELSSAIVDLDNVNLMLTGSWDAK